MTGNKKGCLKFFQDLKQADLRLLHIDQGIETARINRAEECFDSPDVLSHDEARCQNPHKKGYDRRDDGRLQGNPQRTPIDALQNLGHFLLLSYLPFFRKETPSRKKAGFLLIISHLFFLGSLGIR